MKRGLFALFSALVLVACGGSSESGTGGGSTNAATSGGGSTSGSHATTSAGSSGSTSGSTGATTGGTTESTTGASTSASTSGSTGATTGASTSAGTSGSTGSTSGGGAVPCDGTITGAFPASLVACTSSSVADSRGRLAWKLTSQTDPSSAGGQTATLVFGSVPVAGQSYSFDTVSANATLVVGFSAVYLANFDGLTPNTGSGTILVSSINGPFPDGQGGSRYEIHGSIQANMFQNGDEGSPVAVLHATF